MVVVDVISNHVVDRNAWRPQSEQLPHELPRISGHGKVGNLSNEHRLSMTNFNSDNLISRLRARPTLANHLILDIIATLDRKVERMNAPQKPWISLRFSSVSSRTRDLTRVYDIKNNLLRNVTRTREAQ